MTECDDKVEITKVIEPKPEVIEIIEPEPIQPVTEPVKVVEPTEPIKPVEVQKKYEYFFTPMVFFLVFQVLLKFIIKKYL